MRGNDKEAMGLMVNYGKPLDQQNPSLYPEQDEPQEGLEQKRHLIKGSWAPCGCL